MLPYENPGAPGERRGNRQSSRTSQKRPPAQIESIPIKDRIHSLIYGYLLTNGLHTTAEAFQQESDYLRNAIPSAEKPSRVVVLNDRLHDRNLEEIIHIFNREGYFHIQGKMLDFGSELSHLNTKFQTLVSQFGVPNPNRLQQQLYGRYALRTPQSKNYSVNPAPQAIAAMQLQQISKIAEERYRENQQSGSVPISTVEQQHPASQAPPPIPQPEEQQFEQHPQDFEQNFQPQPGDLHGSSRRKHTQPLHMQDRLGNTLHTLVDRINEGNYEVDPSLDLDFLHTMEFNSISFDMNRQDMQFYEDVFNQENVNNQLSLQHEIVDEQVVEAQVGDYSLPPETLLSPVQRVPDYRILDQDGPSEAAVNVAPRKRDNSSTSEYRHEERGKKDEEKDKRSRKLDSRSSRNSSPNHSRSDEKRRHSEREKGSERERSGQEKRRKDDERYSHDIPSSSSSSHRHTSGNNRSKIQEERESTPSSTSSRAERRDDKDKEKEKKRERKEREKREAEAKEKDKQRAKKDKEKDDKDKSKYSGQSSSSAATSNKEYQPQHVLNTMRTSHYESFTEFRGSGKRKVDATIQSEVKSVPFKIPKKTSGSTPSERQAGGGSRDSSRASSPRREKTRKSPPPGVLSDGGEDRPIATHFIKPQGHLARLSSILLNCDANYQKYRIDQASRDKSPSSSAVTLVPNPKGKRFAPMKGDRSDVGNDSEKSSSSAGTYESSDDETHEKASQRSNSSNENRAAAKKPVDDMVAQKLLDRVHGKK